MRAVDLAVLYGVVGVACAVAVVRRERHVNLGAVGSALAALLLWPLWAPVVLTSTKATVTPTPRGPSPKTPEVEEAKARIDRALREGVEACRGTPLAALLSEEAGARIAREVAMAVDRHGEIEGMLGQEGFDVAAAEKRLRDLEAGGSSARAIATARLHLENVRRLEAMKERDVRSLREIEDLVQALRTQLVLMRLSGSSAEGASGIVEGLWARVEGLGVALGSDGRESTPEDDAPQARRAECDERVPSP